MPRGRSRISKHAQNHIPGGSDPLQTCCPPTLLPFPAEIANLADTRSLLGYWRLGEASGTFADSSGQAMPADGTLTTGSTGMTRHVTGALPAGQDDGAIQLNASAGTGSDYITTSSGGDGARFNLGSSNMSISALVKPIASGSSFDGGIIGNLTLSGGWALLCEWSPRTPIFIRSTGAGGVTLIGPAIVTSAWTFIVATYSTTNGHRLYYNGALVASDATVVGGLPTLNLDPFIGFLTPYKSFYGGVDEVSVWADELTAAEIATLATAATASSSPDTDKVITADGAGGTLWKYPTVKVDGARYDEILTGTAIDSIDNTDGTVTLNVDTGAIPPSDPADDTAVWMPLTTTVGGDDVLVFDADHSLIPTLIPL